MMVPKLDVYAVDDSFVDVAAAGIFKRGDRFLSIDVGEFSITYPLADSHRRVVLGVLRGDKDPLDIRGASIVYLIFTYRDGVEVPLRLGVTYLPNAYGDMSSAVVVDGFPVFTTRSRLIDLAAVREYVSRYRLLSSL